VDLLLEQLRKDCDLAFRDLRHSPVPAHMPAARAMLMARLRMIYDRLEAAEKKPGAPGWVSAYKIRFESTLLESDFLH
jgi:hypothetical protein